MSNQIVSFDGGLNTRLHPQFVKPNEAQVFHNVDNFSGTLKSSKGHTPTEHSGSKAFYKFKGKYKLLDNYGSFAEFDQKLFWSTSTQTRYTEDGVVDKSLGTPPPAGTLSLGILEWTDSIALVEEGAIPSDIFEYRLVDANGYTYSLSVNATSFDFVKVTVPYSGTGELRLYRKIGDNFLMVAKSTGADLVDGVVLELDGTDLEEVYSKSGSFFATREYPVDLKLSGMVEHAGRLYFGTTTESFALFTHWYLPSYELLWMSVADNTQSGRLNPPPGIGGEFESAGIPASKLAVVDDNLHAMYTTGPRSVSGVPYSVMAVNTYEFVPTSLTWITRSTGVTSYLGKPLAYNDVDENAYVGMPPYYQRFNGVLNSTVNPSGLDFIYVNGNIGYAWDRGVVSIDITDSNASVVRLSSYAADQYSSGKFGGMSKTIDGNMIFLLGSAESGTLYYFNPVSGKTTTSPIDMSKFYSAYTYRQLRAVEYNFIGEYMYIRYRYSHDSGGGSFTTKDTIWKAKLADLTDNVQGDPIGDDNMTGTYSYKYTSTEASGVNESSPSEKSEEITVEKANVVVTFNDTITTTHTRLYRIGGYDGQFYRLVEEIAVTDPMVDYWDKMNNFIIQTQPKITEEGLIAAYGSMEYLTYHRGRLWGAASELDTNGDPKPFSKNRLFFSELGDPLDWKELNYLLFPTEITSISSTANGLIVTSLDNVYVVLGTVITDFSIVNIDSKDGCTSHLSMQETKGQVFYMGNHGIMSSNGGSTQPISRGKLDLEGVVPKFSAVVDNVYYVDIGNDTVLAFDYRDSGNFYTFSIPNIESMAEVEGRLELSINGVIHTAFTSSVDQTLEYASGRFTDKQPTNLKEYESVWVSYRGTMDLVISIGTQSVVKPLASVNEKVEKVHIPKTANKGYFIQFAVKGKGEINSLEFKNRLREN